MAASVKDRNLKQNAKHYPVAKNIQPAIVGGAQSIYEASTSQQFPLGHVIRVGERTFVYASAGEALNPGYAIQQAAYGGATTTLQNTCAVTVAAAAADIRVYVNALTTAQSAHVFQDGFIAVWDATTAGYSWLFKIKDNTALATSGTTSYVTLYDPLPAALTTDEQCYIIANPYKSVIMHNSASGGGTLGIAPVYVASASYFWLQTWGPSACYPEAVIDTDEDVVISDQVDGAVCPRTSATVGQTVGYCLHIGTAGESAIAFLTIRP